MNINYKSNNGQTITADVRVYTGNMYGDGNYLCTAHTLYQSLKDIWANDEAVTAENVDFEGQTTDIDEYINPENYTSYQAYKSSIDNLLDPSFTSTSHLWSKARKYIRQNTKNEERFYAINQRH